MLPSKSCPFAWRPLYSHPMSKRLLASRIRKIASRWFSGCWSTIHNCRSSWRGVPRSCKPHTKNGTPNSSILRGPCFQGAHRGAYVPCKLSLCSCNNVPHKSHILFHFYCIWDSASHRHCTLHFHSQSTQNCTSHRLTHYFCKLGSNSVGTVYRCNSRFHPTPSSRGPGKIRRFLFVGIACSKWYCMPHSFLAHLQRSQSCRWCTSSIQGCIEHSSGSCMLNGFPDSMTDSQPGCLLIRSYPCTWCNFRNMHHTADNWQYSPFQFWGISYQSGQNQARRAGTRLNSCK